MMKITYSAIPSNQMSFISIISATQLSNSQSLKSDLAPTSISDYNYQLLTDRYPPKTESPAPKTQISTAITIRNTKNYQ